MNTKRKVVKGDAGKFGKILAGEKGFKKLLYGKILYVDYFGAVIFIDNDDIAYRFKLDQIQDFTEEEFKNQT